MVDRQDIDALLVSALYGELTPADEARLAAHLESHPGDRAALDDLKTARAAVKQSRIFETQDEPPQAISAMLLQEAHRRAPKPARVRDDAEHEGWFARLARSFFAHPAMAAAAMLVLVVGVAAIVHNRKGGDEFASKSAPVADNEQLDIDRPGQGGAPAVATPAPPVPAEAAPTGAAGSATFGGIGLDEGKAGSKGDLQQQTDRLRDQADKADGYRNKLEVAKPAPHAAKSPPSVMAVDPDLQPKDLAPTKTPERAKSMKKGAFESDDTTLGRMDNSEATVSRGANNGMAATTPAPTQAPAAPPPPKAAATPKAQLAAPGGGGGAIGGAPSPAAGPTTASDAHSRQLLAQAIQFVKQDQCPEAARLIIQLHDTAPAFYAANVADNRDLTHCMAYAKRNVDQAEERAQQKKSSVKASESVK